MTKATLIRLSTGDEGTVGAILFRDGFALHTLELPWEDNTRNISCIPCAEYVVEIDESPRFGPSYHVRDVPGRTHIIFHRGNWAGRKSMAHLQSNVEGCILVGHDRGTIPPHLDQLAVKNSRLAVDDMRTHLNSEPFELLVMSRIEDEHFTIDT